MKVKRKLSKTEEFEIMKLVMDKFLWFGFGIMAFGLYRSLVDDISQGIYYIISGAVVLIAFMVVIVREFEMIR